MKTLKLLFILSFVSFFVFISCKKDQPKEEDDVGEVPSVKTDNVDKDKIEYNSAILAGEVEAEGSSTVTEKGICWNTTGGPTVDDYKVVASGDDNTIEVLAEGLSELTGYFFRAYAINEAGVGYGSIRSFNLT